MKVDNIELQIVSGLLQFKDFSNVVISHAKTEYFESKPAQILIKLINHYFIKYKTLPVKESLIIEIDKDKTLSDDQYNNCNDFIQKCFDISHDKKNLEYMLETTEEYFRKRAVYNCIVESIGIMDGKDKKRNETAIPSLMEEALKVSFKTHIGHDYFDDFDVRYAEEEDDRIPFKVEILNKITNGGLKRKSITVITATSGAGKSMFKSDWAAFLIQMGFNVAYFTMELSEIEVSKRIDANIFDIPVNELTSETSKSFMRNKLNEIKTKSNGRLKVVEFPTGMPTVLTFKSTLDELKSKEDFIPDVIFIDYLNICSSARMKGDQSYSIVKAITEELRGLAIEMDLPIVTSTQLNRCLTLDTKIETECGSKINIIDVSVGDKIKGSDGYVTVKNKFEVTKQKVYEITTKSGKKIKCSKKHIFPTTKGHINIETGLCVGDSLLTE